MSNRSDLGKPFGGAVEEFVRQERERTNKLLAGTLGASTAVEKHFQSMKPSLDVALGFHRKGIIADLRDAIQRNALALDSFKAMATPAWATAMQETARAISLQNVEIARSVRTISNAMNSDFATVAETLRAQQSGFAMAMEAGRWRENLKSLNDQLAPTLAAFRTTAERVGMFDMATLRASAGHPLNSVRTVTQQALEAERLIGAFASADTPDEGAALLASFFAVVAEIFAAFKGNTVEELRNVGLFKLLELVSMILSMVGAYLLFFPPSPSPKSGHAPAEQHIVSDLRLQVAELAQQVGAIRASEVQLSEQYVADLPRAELSRRANIRLEPGRNATLLLRAESGTLLALKDNRGQWSQVVFRDPLTDQLSAGWIYGDSIRRLD